jgi:hypothetical protein
MEKVSLLGMDEVKISSDLGSYKIITGLFAIIIFCCSGCAPGNYRYFVYKDTLFSELVSYEELPEYNKNTVCQGPAILHLQSETLFCIVRCYDSNNDGEMLSLVHWGIDVFEYSLTVKQEDNEGRLFDSIKKRPRVLIIDANFDGIGDEIYIFKLISADGDWIYEKIDIKSKRLIMNAYIPTPFRLSDFKPYYLLND